MTGCKLSSPGLYGQEEARSLSALQSGGRVGDAPQVEAAASAFAFEWPQPLALSWTHRSLPRQWCCLWECRR